MISKILTLRALFSNFNFQSPAFNFIFSPIKIHPALGKFKYYTNFAPSKKYKKNPKILKTCKVRELLRYLRLHFQ